MYHTIKLDSPRGGKTRLGSAFISPHLRLFHLCRALSEEIPGMLSLPTEEI